MWDDEYAKKMHYLNAYGLTLAQLHQMVEDQQGLCSICRKAMDPPHVDHDHATGQIRGLLCKTCNTGLGMFRDDPRLLAYALVYLETHGRTF